MLLFVLLGKVKWVQFYLLANIKNYLNKKGCWYIFWTAQAAFHGGQKYFLSYYWNCCHIFFLYKQHVSIATE
jgi:hypothetical protein